MIQKFDFLVIGGGIAGMSYALSVAKSGKGKVALVCKTTLDETNTTKAQGGVAAVTNLDVDNFEKHINDTIIAGDYISDLAAVKHVVCNAPNAIKALVQWGVEFDKNGKGEYDLHREGKVTLMATGGVGAVYAMTSNPVIATGDGIAMAYRAKATVKDMEFVQFHPTVLYNPSETHPAFLITEAMRGYGAVLKLPNGKEFMQKYDERLSLAPRDIVARAIDHEMKIHGLDYVCLDLTHKDAEETKRHFPHIYEKCLSMGIDITKQYIPVCPSAHYMCGGIKVDLNGESSISRLYAVGECSCTGLHGGNRLASNSLIEAVVYAQSAAEHALLTVDNYDFNLKVPEWDDEGTLTNEEHVLITQSVREVGEIMSNYVGIVRSNLRLKRAWDRLDLLYEETEELFKRVTATKDICELRNMINVGYLITRQAIERKESRGLHYTVDYPKHAYDQQ